VQAASSSRVNALLLNPRAKFGEGGGNEGLWGLEYLEVISLLLIIGEGGNGCHPAPGGLGELGGGGSLTT